MKNIMLCIRNRLLSDGISNMITKHKANIRLLEESHTTLFKTSAHFFCPDVIVIEVKEARPNTLSEWQERIKKIQQSFPMCKVALIVDDDNSPQIAMHVKECKQKGEIDAFFFASSGLSYLVEAIDSL